MKIRHMLIVLLLAPKVALSADMLYRQSFETPIENNPEIQWLTKGYPLTQKVVDYMPKDGSKSVRGNFNPNIIDPITGIKGEPFTQLKINFKDIPSLKNWYSTTPKIYGSWWYKLDKCFWKGSNYQNTDPLRTTGKFGFLRMNEDPSTSYYFTMNGGKEREAALSANSWNELWQVTYGRPSLWLNNKTVEPWGADSLWHKLSFFIEKKSDGHKYLSWWIDDSMMKSDRFEPEGAHRIYDGFILDSIQFWHSFIGDIENSTAIEGGVCNAWQIDDVQIWNDIPLKPIPPKRK